MSDDALNIFVVAEQFWGATRLLRRAYGQPNQIYGMPGAGQTICQRAGTGSKVVT